ncbi:MAG TPA: DUF2069 domain-containing protein [Fontimonas sp.]
MNTVRNSPRLLSDYAWPVAVVTHLLMIAALGALAVQGSVLCGFAALLLLPSLPGLLRRRRYTYQWTCMLLSIYCALWLAEGWYAPAKSAIAFSVAALAALEFTALALYVRLLNRERPAPAAGSDAA